MAIDYFSPKFLMSVVNQLPHNKSYIGTNYAGLGFNQGTAQQGMTALLPAVPVGTYELTWDVVAAENQLAGIYAIDGEIKPGDEAKISTLFSDVCRVGANRILKEGDVLTLREVGTTPFDLRTVADARRKAESELRRMLGECNDETNATVEYMIMNAMQGSLTWPPTGLPNPPGFAQTNFTITWSDITSGNISALTSGAGVAWSTVASAGVVQDLSIIALAFEEAGVPINDSQLTLIMSQQGLYYLAQNTGLQTALRSTSTGFLDFTQVRRYFQEVLGHTILTYGATYSYRTYAADGLTYTSTRARFLDKQKMIVFPSAMAGELGDLAVAPSLPANWESTKFTWSQDRKNPWVTEVGVGINCFPRIKHPEAIKVYTLNA